MFDRFPGEEQGEEVKDVLRTNNPSKRMADPLEIAKLAVYLASDDSAYVVGADFLIDGGVTAISPVGAGASLQSVEETTDPHRAFRANIKKVPNCRLQGLPPSLKLRLGRRPRRGLYYRNYSLGNLSLIILAMPKSVVSVL